MAIWYGKGCKVQQCMWEETEETGGKDYMENTPTLIFCNHKRNPESTEGNCRKEICPLKATR